ncbi:MAG: glycosyltransferase family 39 protein [Ignavibacteriales bacterium]|nr:glycosyltransferase family 39 protein [Ignavibacteriales bacterium]
MKNNITYQIWFFFSLISLTFIGIYSFKLPFHGDERHIVETIRLFADNFNFSTIKDYPEVTPPFFYIFYSLWAKLFNSSIESLRLLTLIISFITWQLLFYLIKLFIKNDIHVFLLSLLIVINPYFFGTSVFVFTDILTIMLSLAAVISFAKDKIIYFVIFSALAILCRQYAGIIPIAVLLYSSFYYVNDKSTSRKFIFGSFLTFIPLIILFGIWENISPASGIEKWIVPNSSLYNLDYINTYITFSVIYILPLAIIFFKKIKFNYTSLLIAFVLTILLSFFPVKTSLATLEFTDYKTVGIMHQTLADFFGLESLGIKIILWVFLFVGCYINTELLKRFYSQIKSRLFDKEIIFTFLWILFLIIMPFSYQVWEKYLTMIIPFLVICIYCLIFPIEQDLNI